MVLKEYAGEVTVIEEGIATLWLDNGDKQAVATIDVASLEKSGITTVGDMFTCIIKHTSEGTQIEFKVKERKVLTVEEWEEIQRKTREAVGDYDTSDDY